MHQQVPKRQNFYNRNSDECVNDESGRSPSYPCTRTN